MDFADWLKQKGQTCSDARRHILAADDVVGVFPKPAKGWWDLIHLNADGAPFDRYIEIKPNGELKMDRRSFLKGAAVAVARVLGY